MAAKMFFFFFLFILYNMPVYDTAPSSSRIVFRIIFYIIEFTFNTSITVTVAHTHTIPNVPLFIYVGIHFPPAYLFPSVYIMQFKTKKKKI